MRTLRYFATEKRNPPKLDAYEGRERVAACLQILTLLPVVYNAAAMKRSVRSSLSEVLGISKSHMAKGGLATLKPRMQAKAHANAIAYGKARAQKKGWSEEDFQKVQDTVPKLANGKLAPLASWVHVIQSVQSAPLPLNVALALERDELIDFLLQATIDDEPAAFRDAVLEAIVEDTVESPDNADGDLLHEWARLETWEDITAPFAALTQVLLVTFIAALDAEWGARYFGGFEPQPVFLWVAPRMNPNQSAADKVSRRSPVMRPTRRLLELSYAVVEHAYLGVWPDGPPGRSAVSAAMGLEDYVVGNLFDGTRRLGFDEFEENWLQMCRQPRLQRKRKGFRHFPNILAYVAIGMEAMLVETGPRMKFLSALLLDEVDYRGRWAYFREHWKSELEMLEQPATPLEAWPAWLRSQSILPPPPPA